MNLVADKVCFRYLIDQFISESINNRTDKWGGSVENRARFLLEVIKATVEEIGAERTALRLSPFATYQGAYSHNTWEQFGYIFNELKKAGYKLAYVSLVEPRGNPAYLDATTKDLDSDKVNPFGGKKEARSRVWSTSLRCGIISPLLLLEVDISPIMFMKLLMGVTRNGMLSWLLDDGLSRILIWSSGLSMVLL